ncbi:GntR family transcriptional regulator [Lapillicoccus sp.]|uniref:GntR family transcriptional regulator n=1 Tax=Lapillicoccus sp. TaxID=1909287 RepID=UPI0025CF4B85|nr:GntR family transcriptional regulator [Lapillicoccus sp.]
MKAKRIDVSIDRSSPVPLYHQLAEQLTAAIVSGELQPGDPFENELDLVERLAVSRPTVRRAIAELVAKGLLLRRQGLGTRVANRKVHRRAELSSLYDDLARDGDNPQTRVLSIQRSTDAVAAQALDLPDDTAMIAIVRLRLAGGRPFAILRNWLPAAVDLGRAELETSGLYAVLRARGIRPVVAHQQIGARMPTPQERRELELKGTQPLLTMTRSAFDASGAAVEYGSHCYRAEDYTIEVMVDER